MNRYVEFHFTAYNYWEIVFFEEILSQKSSKSRAKKNGWNSMKLHIGIVFKVFLKKNLLWFTSNAFNNICLSRIEWVSKWLLLNANSAIFQLYHGEKRSIFNEMVMRSALYYTNTLSWIFIVIAYWHNSP